ncbi:hypothetical protein [Hafnia paralvei]|uniref:hypothetical protein n=1 Tax=Hafnia paralvei TaxID=546367 RepID=UPI001F2E8ADF|nr:hypothetical protein [Hafnia paralvei]MCE9948327.1 hypothetical protein [Hafnia paralvei]
MTSREQFEAWFKYDYHPDKTGPYIKDIMFVAWQASREAVEVDKIDGSRLAHVYLESTTADKVDAYVKGWNACIDRIKVKGE